MEEPETSENPMQTFEIHYIFRRRTQLLAVIIYSVYRYLFTYRVIFILLKVELLSSDGHCKDMKHRIALWLCIRL